ncbi:hypothetical protein [Catenuloplanes japonicus]|uniref:hypothetical protein n=1 Tax=Catenuloplanes japonicus TaxID=33876 RepID=UPI000690AEBD|nr:hypothetical protein [Catenuloplanes japonicus]
MTHPGERQFYREQDVTLTGPGGARATGRLGMWIEGVRSALSLDGPPGTFESRAGDFFDALIGLRRQLAPLGWAIAVQGARADAYPSPMQRERSALQLYRRITGRKTSRDDIVKIFDPLDPALIVTPEDQRARFESWLESVPKD